MRTKIATVISVKCAPGFESSPMGERMFAISVVYASPQRNGYVKRVRHTVFSPDFPKVGQQIEIQLANTSQPRRPLDDWELEEFKRLQSVGYIQKRA